MRPRTLIPALAVTVLAAAAAGPALARDPSVPQVEKRLAHARHQWERARQRAAAATADLGGARELYRATGGGTTPVPGLTPPAAMDQTVGAALLADGVVTSDELVPLAHKRSVERHRAHRLDRKVRRLQRRLRELRQIAAWNRRGQWKPLIAIACDRYHVSAAGLTHMMWLESRGQRYADSGPYHGLFQFMDREWAMSMNEWKDHSIYDGWSQIQLAAKCVGRGMGPSIWPLTYRMSF